MANFILPFNMKRSMNSRAQRMPDEYMEGSSVTRRGKTRTVAKPYKQTPSRKKLPPVEARHHGEQNDLGFDPDFSMNLDPSLPTVEEVQGSYGNVFKIKSYTWLFSSLI